MSVEGVHTMFIPGVVSCDPKGGGGGQSTCHLGFCRSYLDMILLNSPCWSDCAEAAPLMLK